MTGINGEWRHPVSRRCDRKSVYPSMRKAARYAEAATLREGELILAVDCPDCGKFHLAHADNTQLLARGLPPKERPTRRAV